MTTITTAAKLDTIEAPRTFSVIPPRPQHLAEWGFESFRAYRLWCLRQGLEDGLGKKKHRAAQCPKDEEEIAAHHTEERRQRLVRFADGEDDWTPDVLLWLRGNKPAQQAFLSLLLHVDRYMDALKFHKIRANGKYRSLIHGLAALAYHHQRWIRPLEEWSCALAKGGHPRRCEQFSSLLRHLLARYEVPEFMDSAFFAGIRERGLQQQEWFMHVATGGNIRKLNTPIKLSKRMAHLFMRAPDRATIERNLRWAQIIGMGGSPTLATAILRTRLGRQLEDDNFWSSVVLFLVNNAMLDPNWAGPLVDYVHNMKFAQRRIVQEGGGVEAGPPPQPNFSMKGRSATKLLRQVDAWHGHLNREEHVDFQTWLPCGIRPYEVEEEAEELGPVRWTVQELLSSWELAAEGRAMSHCAVSYSNHCADGYTSVWSICLQKQGQQERENVLTVAIDIEERTVTQARGRYNSLPHRQPKTAKAKRESASGYFKMLDRSDYILRMWTERERMRRTG